MPSSPCAPDLVTHLRTALGFRRVKVDRGSGDLQATFLDLSRHKFNRFENLPFFSVSEDLAAQGCDRVAAVLRDRILALKVHDRVSVATLPQEVAGLGDALEERDLQVAVFLPEDVARVRSGSFDDFLRHVSPQVPISVLSPYAVAGPVTGGQFFGRERDLRTIISQRGKSYAVTGVRKIGKTSVLLETKRRLDRQREPTEFVDCTGFESAEQFIANIVARLEGRGLRRIEMRGYRETLAEYLHRHAIKEGPLTLFLDEVDSLICLDRGAWTVSGVLRSAWQQGSCRLIVSGQPEVKKEIANRGSPYFNFLESLSLGCLTRKETRALVVDPMRGLGIRLDDEAEVVNLVFHETGGHPNLVQWLCHQALQEIDRRDGARILGQEELFGVRDDPEFRSFVLATFEFNTSYLGKAIVYALGLHDEDRRYTMRDVTECLQQHDIEFRAHYLVWQALGDLCSAGFLAREGKRYRFINHILLHVLFDTADAADLLAAVRDQIVRSGP